MSTVNYPVVIAVFVLAIVFIIWIVRRNLIDKSKFEKETIQSELDPEKHDNDETRL